MTATTQSRAAQRRNEIASERTLARTVRAGRVGPGGEYAGVHVGTKLRTKRRGEYYVGVSAGRRIAAPY
jgi:hypothetical protein